ncbi:LVIVD repeat-containing protein [Sphingobium sp. HWE2-09]|uniref:LVIVD repeat-containing protein n=1 Tax=Sphingobium sp. HWE2-09 TaxID=3108390 RepID=UPI002DC30040|nr:hypothetical protein [Sphingobium sp. HWE2-09]
MRMIAPSILAFLAASSLGASAQEHQPLTELPPAKSPMVRFTSPTPFEPKEKIPLEHHQYIKNMKVLGRLFAGTDAGEKLQFMVRGNRRYLLQGQASGTKIIEVSDPLKPEIVNSDATPECKGPCQQLQVAYHEASGRWLMIQSSQKYDLDQRGLRGIFIYDVSDPAAVKLLSKWSVDGGSPDRVIQTGSGPHRNYWDGGRYLYLTTAADNNFYFEPKNPTVKTIGYVGYKHGIQILDISDPTQPKLVTNIHYPGQRVDEEEARNVEPWTDDLAYTMMHGPLYVPQRLESGGKLGFIGGGAFGLLIYDLTNLQAPRLLSEWRPTPYEPGPAIAAHTVDISRLDRGFVVLTPEALFSGCVTPRNGSFIIDVTDPAKPKELARLPRPVPPAAAPYKDFCQRAGRFSPHNPPHLKAPGKVDPNFLCHTYFNAGLQCFDIKDPRRPTIAAYFVPEQPEGQLGDGALAKHSRTVDEVFIEWDRKLIWVATDTGIYLLSAPALGKPNLAPMPVTQWALPSINVGAK